MKNILVLLLMFSSINLIHAQCDDFEVEVTFSHPSCQYFSDGNINGTAMGGTEPYLFEISNSDGDVLVDIGMPILSAGWYYIYVEDAIGCVFYDSVELIDPAPLLIEDMDLIDPSAEGVCDGSISINEVSGDYEYISYYWLPDPDGISGIGANVMDDACAGNYTVFLNSDIGCTNVYEDLIIGEHLSIASNALDEIEVRIINGKMMIQNDQNDKLVFQLFTINGQDVLSDVLQTGENSFQLKSGIYILAISDTNGNSKHQKIVFQ